MIDVCLCLLFIIHYIGASSVVYKALDLQTMQLVAIKMISFYDRS